MEPVSISISDTEFLTGEYLAGAADLTFAVVWVHGFGSHRGGEKATAVCAECARREWAFAAFDFRGHGASSGAMLDLRAGRLIEDLAAVRDFLAARGHTRLGLVGSSMGGFAAAWFTKAHREAVLGCVFVAPGFSFLERRWNSLSETERAAWQRTGRLRVTKDWVDVEIGSGLPADRNLYSPESLAAGWDAPALLFHGLADDVVPASDSLDFITRSRYPGIELRLFKDGDHRLTAYKEEVAAGAGRFFARLLTTTAAPRE